MRELRAAVNAAFLFVLFLFVWGLVRPGTRSRAFTARGS